MGLSTSTETEPAVNCQCWPPGETPPYILITVAGVQRGEMEPGVFFPYPNGTYQLEYVGLGMDLFRFIGVDYIAIFFISFGMRELWVTSQIKIGEGFIARDDELCVWHYNNIYQGGFGNYFFGGHAAVTWFTPGAF